MSRWPKIFLLVLSMSIGAGACTYIMSLPIPPYVMLVLMVLFVMVFAVIPITILEHWESRNR